MNAPGTLKEAPFLEGLKTILEAVARPRPGEPETLTLARVTALKVFLQEGLPDRTREAWRHSDPSFIWEKALRVDPTIPFEIVNNPGGILWSGPRSSPDLDAGNLSIFPLEGRPLAALQVALADNALIVRVPHGMRIPDPLLLRHRLPASGLLTASTLHLILEEGAELAVRVDHEGGSSDSLSLPAVRVLLAKGAHLTWSESSLVSDAARQISLFEAHLNEDARLDLGLILSTGKWMRHDLRVRMSGPGATATLRGLTLGQNDQHLDLHTFTDHAVGSCVSDQLFKGVVADRATAVYNGEVLVREGAKGTDARQTNRNLVLSDEATVFSEPRLEIYHDDVRCTHGSATGPLDEEAVFYLRSRGLDAQASRRLILRAFVAEVFEGVKGLEGLRTVAETWMKNVEARA